jgi:hypothetical protein
MNTELQFEQCFYTLYIIGLPRHEIGFSMPWMIFIACLELQFRITFPDHVNLDSSPVLVGIVIGVHVYLKPASMVLDVELGIMNQSMTKLGWCNRFELILVMPGLIYLQHSSRARNPHRTHSLS